MSWLSQLLEKNNPDPRVRLELGQLFLNHLTTARLPSDSKTINDYCDLIFQWISASNFKVALLSFEILHTSMEVSGDVLAPYLLERLSSLVERLGDSKAQVRDAASSLIVNLASVPHSSAALVLEKITPGFMHKQWMVRTGIMQIFMSLLSINQNDLEVQANRLVPTLCKLMSDPNLEVRETAANTIVHLMIVLGEDIGTSIRNRHLMPDSKMQILIQRYDEALRRGSPPSAELRPARPIRRLEPRTPSYTNKNGEVDQENQIGRGHSSVPRGSSMPAQKRAGPTTTIKTSGSAGAVSEDDFRKAFTQVPKCDIYSAKELQSQLESIKICLENTNQDWSKRVNSLKLLRSLVLNGAMNFETELIVGVQSMEDALQVSVKDLRSQVCREACITICLLCEKLEARIVRLYEALLPATMMLIQNSAKVMATSGILTCQFIIKNVEHPKLIPIVLAHTTSKSKEIRRQTQNLIYQMLSIWTESKLERSMTAIVESIKLGISDADPQARAAARNGYQQLEMHYPQQAQFLYQALDPSKQKSLSGAVSAASSSQSIGSERDSLLMGHRPGNFGLNRPKAFFSGRSASEIDSGSVRRAAAYTPVKSRLVGTTAARNSPVRPTPSRSGLPPTRQTPLKTSNSVNPPGSLSQPGSRSTSPTRFSTNRRVAASGMTTSSRILTSIPKNSMGREQSPRRYSSGRSSNGFSNGSVQQDMQRAVFNAIKNFSMNADDDEEFLLGGILKFDQADLTDAIRSCTSSNLNEKKEGLRALLEILRSGRSLPSSDIKKVCDTINKLLTEGNHKLMSNVLDILAVFVKSHHDSLTEWLQILLVRLLQKSGMEILPTVQNQLSSALHAVRLAFRADLQLTALCKYIQDPIHTPPVKVKGATLNYLNELLHIMDPGTELNRGEVRGAVYKIFQWMEDPKNNSIRMACERVIYGLFSLNTADFSSVLATFPPAWKEFAFGLLKKNGSGESNAPPSIHDNISEMSAQITDYVDSRVTMQPIGTLPPRTNGNSRHSSTPSEADTSGLSDGMRIQLDTTISLAEDPIAQNNYVAGLFKEISQLEPTRRAEQCSALLTLHQMIGEGSFTTWDENFKPLLLHIFEVLKVSDAGLKKQALRLLSKICLAQPARLYDLAEMTVFKVLDSVTDEENLQVIHVADECLKTLAIHLPLHIVIRALNPIIAQLSDPRVGPSLKMLTRLVEAMEPDELLPVLPDITPGVVNCYSSTVSSIRKCTVFCLVAMVNKLGREPVNVYLSVLPNNKIHLLEVYIQRAQTSSTHF